MKYFAMFLVFMFAAFSVHAQTVSKEDIYKAVFGPMFETPTFKLWQGVPFVYDDRYVHWKAEEQLERILSFDGLIPVKKERFEFVTKN